MTGFTSISGSITVTTTSLSESHSTSGELLVVGLVAGLGWCSWRHVLLLLLLLLLCQCHSTVEVIISYSKRLGISSSHGWLGCMKSGVVSASLSTLTCWLIENLRSGPGVLDDWCGVFGHEVYLVLSILLRLGGLLVFDGAKSSAKFSPFQELLTLLLDCLVSEGSLAFHAVVIFLHLSLQIVEVRDVMNVGRRVTGAGYCKSWPDLASSAG